MPRIAMLVNPVFSAWRRRSIPRIQQVFEQAGLEVDLTETGHHRDATTIARRAAQDDVDAVIVCGGDGTVFDVLQGLAGSTVPIGILPFGTGNVLVQNLGLPRHPIAAARALLKATPISVPLGKITCGAFALLPGAPPASRSWYFAMSAGIGGHAAMMRLSHRYRKHSTGRLAYFAAGFHVLLTHPLAPFEIDITTVDGEHLTRQVSEMIAVRVGRLNLWRTGSSLYHPFLRLASVEGASRLRLAQASFESLVLRSGERGRPLLPFAAARYEDVLRITARPLAGRSYKAPLALQADGEIVDVLTPHAPVTIEMAGLSATFLSATS